MVKNKLVFILSDLMDPIFDYYLIYAIFDYLKDPEKSIFFNEFELKF